MYDWVSIFLYLKWFMFVYKREIKWGNVKMPYTKFLTCIDCGESKRAATKELCHSCYNKRRYIKILESQGKEKRNKPKVRECKDCKGVKKIVRYGRCGICNNRFLGKKERLPKIRPCLHCGKVTSGLKKDLCSKCWYVMDSYGLTRAEYDILVSGPCEICETTEEFRVCDHSHVTGLVRGALCNTCNVCLGMLQTRPPGWVDKALEYLSLKGS